MSDPKIEMVSVDDLRPYANNARKHSKKQIAQIAESIRRFGFTNPVLISDTGEILAGHGRVRAAQRGGPRPTRRPTLIQAERALQGLRPVKGDAYAQECHLKPIEQAEKEEAEEIERINIGTERYIASCHEAIEAARRAGEAEPEFLLHPDDIIVEAGKRLKIVGPASQEELEYYKRACALRDIVLMQYTLEGRRDHVEAQCNVALISVIEARLPVSQRTKLSLGVREGSITAQRRRRRYDDFR